MKADHFLSINSHVINQNVGKERIFSFLEKLKKMMKKLFNCIE